MTAAACAAAAADGVSAVDRELRAPLAFELPARGDGNTVAVLLVGDRGAPADGLNAAPLAADEGRSRPGDDKRAR